MCILVVARGCTEVAGLLVAANRDELRARPWRSPRLVSESPRVFAGVDLVGGGSWLALNLDGRFVVGVTNAHLGASPGPRSRGTLVLDLAAQSTVAEAVALLAELDLAAYGAFNVLLADANGAWLASNEPVSVRAVRSPVVAIGNDPLDHPTDRVRFAAATAGTLLGADGDPVDGLRTMLADHEGRDPLCRHGDRYGTVSSTIVELSPSSRRYLFATGQPCTTPFETLELPLPRVH